MTRFRDRPFLSLALTAALVASLGLAACGRKGPLDPPPGASLEGVPQPNMPDVMSSKGRPAPIGSDATADNPGVGPDGQAQAPKGPKKKIPLDVLLN